MSEQELMETMWFKDAKELVEMREVLKWASENVQLVEKTTDQTWACAWKDCRFTVQPTLYQALLSAWKSAHPSIPPTMM